jgi:hypothetical protein
LAGLVRSTKTSLATSALVIVAATAFILYFVA